MRKCVCLYVVRELACTMREEEGTGEGEEDSKAYPEVNHNIAPIHKEDPTREIRLGGNKALPGSIRTSAQHFLGECSCVKPKS